MNKRKQLYEPHATNVYGMQLIMNASDAENPPKKKVKATDCNVSEKTADEQPNGKETHCSMSEPRKRKVAVMIADGGTKLAQSASGVESGIISPESMACVSKRDHEIQSSHTPSKRPCLNDASNRLDVSPTQSLSTTAKPTTPLQTTLLSSSIFEPAMAAVVQLPQQDSQSAPALTSPKLVATKEGLGAATKKQEDLRKDILGEHSTDDSLRKMAKMMAQSSAPQKLTQQISELIGKKVPLFPKVNSDISASTTPDPSPSYVEGVVVGRKHDETWNEMFFKLQDFKREKGHSNVPQTYKADKKLGRWAHYQRIEYWSLQQEGTGKITEDRITCLNRIGFEWDSRAAQWEQMFQKLIKYKYKNGHCQVPKNHKEDKQLANWVRNQRLEMANLKKGKKSRMNSSRIVKLDNIGFSWSRPPVPKTTDQESQEPLASYSMMDEKAKPTPVLADSPTSELADSPDAVGKAAAKLDETTRDSETRERSASLVDASAKASAELRRRNSHWETTEETESRDPLVSDPVVDATAKPSEQPTDIDTASSAGEKLSGVARETESREPLVSGPMVDATAKPSEEPTDTDAASNAGEKHNGEVARETETREPLVSDAIEDAIAKPSDELADPDAVGDAVEKLCDTTSETETRESLALDTRTQSTAEVVNIATTGYTATKLPKTSTVAREPLVSDPLVDSSAKQGDSEGNQTAKHASRETVTRESLPSDAVVGTSLKPNDEFVDIVAAMGIAAAKLGDTARETLTRQRRTSDLQLDASTEASGELADAVDRKTSKSGETPRGTQTRKTSMQASAKTSTELADISTGDTTEKRDGATRETQPSSKLVAQPNDKTTTG